MNINGGYTYTLNNSSPIVQNLTAGEVVQDTFTYTVADGAGGTDTATLTINVTGSQDLTSPAPNITPLNNATGLNGEYYGYNDSAAPGAGFRTHSDDGTATFGNNGVAGNLNSVEDIYTIINARNFAGGGTNNLVGTSASSAANVADVTFKARTLDYGFNPTVNSSLGSVSNVAAGAALGVGDNAANSATLALSNFLDQDRPTAFAQTGALNTGGTSGLGRTTDAAIRLSGQMYVQAGNYDFRVTADDGFRLSVAGQTLLEFDGNQAPTTRIFNNVSLGNLNGGLQAVELLYWEQGGNARLRIEYKLSSAPVGSFQALGLGNTALFTTENAPVVTNPELQDLVYDSATSSWQLRTGSRLDGDAANNILTGGAGRDYITGGDGNDVLNGGAGSDTLYGGNDNDTINGGDGSDLLVGGAGSDVLVGGKGDDTYRLSDKLDTITEIAGEGTDTVQLDGLYVAANIGSTYTLATDLENLTAFDGGAINLTGNAAANRIEGNTSSNTIIGGAGNDFIIGGAGNDTLTGGSGSDTFVWRLADKGAVGAPAIDNITDFNYIGGYSNVDNGSGQPTGGGDVLDLRDLLQGERSSVGSTGNATANVEVSNLLSYLDITTQTTAGVTDTVIRVSSSGGFAGGNYSTGAEDQRIVLNGVNLYSATSVTAGDEATLLKQLLKSGTLIID